MNHWLEIQCTKCQKTNWINDGDPTDPTACDAQAVRCWNCGTVNQLNKDSEHFSGDIIQDGLKAPNHHG